MANFLPPVIAVLSADIREFTTKMNEAKGQMAETDSSMAGMSAGTKKALLGLGAAALGFAYESVKMASGFDQAMEMVHTQAGASQGEVDKLKGSVLALAPAVGMGPEELATGLYHIESAGFRSTQAMDILTASAKLATIGQSDFETTSQAVVGVMASQIKGVKDAADAGNLLNTTVGMGDMKMQQLADAIGTGILPKAAAAGLSFEDVGSALATITDNVTPANEAATRLGMTFSLMSAPTAKAQKAYESIGMSSVQLANDMRSKGLLGALEDLKTHLDATYPPSQKVKLSLQEQGAQLKTYSDSLAAMGVPLDQQTTLLAQFKKQLEQGGSAAVKQSAALSAMFGGGKSSGTMMTLLGEMDRFKDKTTQYGTAASRAAQAQEAWQAQQAQFGQKLKDLGATFDVMFVKIGQKLIPVLSRFLGWIQAGISWLGQHKAVLAVLAGLVAGALVSALYAAVAAAIAWTAALDVNPIFLVITAIAGLVGGLIYAYQHFTAFRNIVDAVGRFFKTVWQDAVKVAGAVIQWFVSGPLVWIKARLAELSAFWQQHGAQIIEIARAVWSVIWTSIKVAWDLIWGYLSTGFKVLSDMWKFTWDVVRGTVDVAWTMIKDIVTAAWHNVLNVFAVFVDLLTGKWGQLWTDAKKLVTQGWDDVTKIFGDFISKAGTWLWQAGKDLLQGLLNGIKDALGGLLSTVSNVGASILSTMKHAVGAHSPSVEAHKIGRFIGQGLADGLDSMHGAVVDSAGRLGASALAGGGLRGVNLAGSGVGGGVSSGGGMVIVVNVAGAVHSDQGIAKVVRTEVLRYQQRNSRNNLTLAGIGG